MKNLILTALLFSLFHGVYAQNTEHENKIVLGGFTSFHTQNNTFPFSSLSRIAINSIGGIYANNTNDTKYTTFAFTPYLGKEINPHWIVGVQLDYRFEKYTANDVLFFGQTNPIDTERNTDQIGIGIFARYIFNPKNQLNFFLQPNIGYNLLNEEALEDSKVVQEQKTSYLSLSVGAGMLYNINDKIRATLRTGGLTYINGNWEIKDTNEGNKFSSFGANFNLSNISFGFEIRI